MRFNKNLCQSAFLIVITLLFSTAINFIVNSNYSNKSLENYNNKPIKKIIDSLPEIEYRGDIFEEQFVALDVPNEHLKIFDSLNIILNNEELDSSSTKLAKDELKTIQKQLDSNVKSKADYGKLTSYLELKKFKLYNKTQQYDTALYWLNIFLNDNKLDFYEKEREILNFRIHLEKLKKYNTPKETIEFFENRLDSLEERKRKQYSFGSHFKYDQYSNYYNQLMTYVCDIPMLYELDICNNPLEGEIPMFSSLVNVQWHNELLFEALPNPVFQWKKNKGILEVESQHKLAIENIQLEDVDTHKLHITDKNKLADLEVISKPILQFSNNGVDSNENEIVKGEIIYEFKSEEDFSNFREENQSITIVDECNCNNKFSLDEYKNVNQSSNFGEHSLSVSAYGENINGYDLEGLDVVVSGTSMATFHVSRELAIESSKNTNKNYEQIWQDFENNRLVETHNYTKTKTGKNPNPKYNDPKLENDFSATESHTFPCRNDDWIALKALYYSTNGDNWINRTGWEQITIESLPENCNLGNLYGVELNELGRVSSINLLNNQLSGIIPKEISNLSNLKELFLHENELNGNIPVELGNLENLTLLDLRDNNLTGRIPLLSNLTNLTSLKLYNNNLSGCIPDELGSLLNLKELDLGKNQLSGEIPHSIGNLANLEELNLSYNKLTGDIPEFRNLSNLTYLDLKGNKLRGSISANYGNELVSKNIFGIRAITGDLESDSKLKIIPLKAFNNKDEDNLFDLICGIYHAVDCDADVINISSSYIGEPSGILEEAIDYARKKDVFIVAAAGNSGIDIDESPQYPAYYASAFHNVISVASIGPNNEFSELSNYGNESVTLVAPSTNIAGYSIDNTEIAVDRKTVSTFFVARELASEIASDPNRSHQQIRDDFIRNRTVNNNPTKDLTITGKRLDSELFKVYNTCFTPSNIQLDDLSSDAVCVATDQFDNIEDHILEYRSIGDEWKEATQTATNKTIISGLMPCSKYEVRVKSNWLNNESAFSHPLNFTTKCEDKYSIYIANIKGNFNYNTTVNSLDNYFTNKKEKGKTYALLIGINGYKNVKDLHYSINDLNLLKETLENNYSKTQNKLYLTILKDKDATKQNILSALNNIRTKVKPDDNILIYYVGHGISQVEGTTNQEIIACQIENTITSQSILPYDFSYQKPNSDLLISDINEIFKDANTLNPPLIIVDACRTIASDLVDNNLLTLETQYHREDWRNLQVRDNKAYTAHYNNIADNYANDVLIYLLDSGLDKCNFDSATDFLLTNESVESCYNFGVSGYNYGTEIVDADYQDRFGHGTFGFKSISEGLEEASQTKIVPLKIIKHVTDGGSGIDQANTSQYPAYYTSKYRWTYKPKLDSVFYDDLITVARIKVNNQLNVHSNYGTQSVDIAAPGYEITSVDNRNVQQIWMDFESQYLVNDPLLVANTCADTQINIGISFKDEKRNITKSSKNNSIDWRIPCRETSSTQKTPDLRIYTQDLDELNAIKPKLIILNATSVGNQSVGLREFGHGLFTYNLVKSLKKKSGVDLNNDNYISLQESKADIDKGVQKTKNKRGDINQQSDLYFYK